MVAFVGRDILVEWGGVAVPGVREKGISCAGEPINVTSDEDDGIRKLLTNQFAEKQIDISVSGVTKTAQLRHDWVNGQLTKTLEIEYPDGSVLSGSFFLASYNDTGPYNDAATFEASFQSAGAWTYTPAS